MPVRSEGGGPQLHTVSEASPDTNVRLPLPPITRGQLLRLAAPAAASAVLNNAFRVIDQLAAGSISTPAQAAIGSCVFVLIAIYSLHVVVAGGAGPLYARGVGAGDIHLRHDVVRAGVRGCLLVAVGVGVIGALGAAEIARLLGLDPETATLATTFLRTICILDIPLALGPFLDACFVASGRTGTMMILQVMAALINALLNPLLIHEAGLGVMGAAIATAVSRGVTSTIGLHLLLREVGMGWSDLPTQHTSETLRRILRVGAPLTVNGIAYAGVYFLVLRTSISPMGPVQNAALGIGFSALEGVSYPMFLGVSLAVSSLVGRHLGAGNPAEAARALRVGFPLATALGLFAAFVFYFGARTLCAPFTHDPAVLEAAIVYAKALAWTQLFVSWEALAEGVLAGAGDSRAIFWLSAPFNALRVPLAWGMAFPLAMGANGVWWALNLTSVMKAASKGVAAARGGWMTTKV